MLNFGGVIHPQKETIVFQLQTIPRLQVPNWFFSFQGPFFFLIKNPEG